LFSIQDKAHIGVLKSAVKAAILEGRLADDRLACIAFLKQEAKALNISEK
jgi:hypothetical protein